MPHAYRAFFALVTAGLLSVTAPADLGEHLDALDAPDLETRERATEALAEDPGITLAEIARALGSENLSAEQRLRLEAAGWERFRDLPKPGLGVQFATDMRGDGVRLQNVLGEFPAARTLRPRDVVIEINGEAIPDQSRMRAEILSHAPGDVLEMKIERPTGPPQVPGAPATETLTVEVRLGRFEELNPEVDNDPQIGPLRGGYQLRLERLADRADPPVAGGGLAPMDWLRAEGYDADAPAAPFSRLEPVAAWRHIALAGQAGSALANIELRRGEENLTLRRNNAALRARSRTSETEQAVADYRVMVRRLVQIRGQLDGSSGSPLLDPERDAERRRRLRSEMEDLRRDLDELRVSLEDASG